MPGGAASVRSILDPFVCADVFLSGAGSIAFAIRAGLNLVLAMLRFGQVSK